MLLVVTSFFFLRFAQAHGHHVCLAPGGVRKSVGCSLLFLAAATWPARLLSTFNTNIYLPSMVSCRLCLPPSGHETGNACSPTDVTPGANRQCPGPGPKTQDCRLGIPESTVRSVPSYKCHTVDSLELATDNNCWQRSSQGAYYIMPLGRVGDFPATLFHRSTFTGRDAYASRHLLLVSAKYINILMFASMMIIIF